LKAEDAVAHAGVINYLRRFPGIRVAVPTLSTIGVALSGVNCRQAVSLKALSDAIDICVLMERNPDISQDEIGAKLGLSQTTVHRRLQVLQDVLQESMRDPG
jgi:hypothetical protein